MKLSDLAGHWALVTGASSGIGREYARQLAGRGMNTVLVARRQHLLDELAGELRAVFKTDARPLAVDLTSTDDVGKELRAVLAGQGIMPRFICNNAGRGRWD